jgi:hypothetical protein
MRLARELGGSHVGHPDLHWAETLCAEASTVLTHSLLDARVFLRGSHRTMLHVTLAKVPEDSACGDGYP